MMNFDQYQIEALKTRNQSLDWLENVQHSLLMLASEVGEIAGTYQKFVYQGHDVPKPEDTAKELGDVLWAMSNLADLVGYSLEEIAEMNIAKLRKRYGESFSEEGSVNRLDVT